MTPAELRSTCITLFGKHWQTGLSRFLTRDDGTHTNVRTVRRWAKGEHEVPVAVEILLRAELARRAL
jgi:hypothetical protein